jgi:hypothetical protein
VPASLTLTSLLLTLRPSLGCEAGASPTATWPSVGCVLAPAAAVAPAAGLVVAPAPAANGSVASSSSFTSVASAGAAT